MWVAKEKAKPLRRSKTFTPEQNARLDKLESIEEEEEVEQPSFDMGLKKMRITRSNSSKANQQ